MSSAYNYVHLAAGGQLFLKEPVPQVNIAHGLNVTIFTFPLANL
jgi:hypothetical protein